MISTVIPAYNAGTYLIEAVDSVLLQDADEELILIDDHSTDDSVQRLIGHLQETYRISAVQNEGNEIDYAVLCALPVLAVWQGIVSAEVQSTQLAGVDDRQDTGKTHDVSVRIYRNKTNQGVAETRNVGVRLAQGEYVALLDADDIWMPGKLRRQLQVLQATGACLCNTARRMIQQDGSDTGHVIHTPECITLAMLQKTNYINCSSVLTRRDVLLRYPMCHDRDAHEDYLTWLMLLREYDRVVGIDEPYLKYRLSAQGKSRNKCKAARMTYRTYRYAGYGMVRALWMMLAYMINGVRKMLF